jgi:hypothetical protein
MTEMENEKQNQANVNPPYISFLTFMNALQSLIEHGVPGQIDKSVLSKFSGGIQRQLYPALNFIGFIDENNYPTDLLQEYADQDKDGQKSILQKILKSRFAEQIAILPNGTMQQLQDSFNYIDLKSSVKSKCITFFLKMAEYSGFDISPHISKGMRKRAVTTKKTTRKRTIRQKTRPAKKDQQSEIELEIPNLKKVPIPLGIDKTWYVFVDEEYNEEDIKKFTQIIELTLAQ